MIQKLYCSFSDTGIILSTRKIGLHAVTFLSAIILYLKEKTDLFDIAQARLFRAQPPKCPHYRHVPPHLYQMIHFAVKLLPILPTGKYRLTEKGNFLKMNC